MAEPFSEETRQELREFISNTLFVSAKMIEGKPDALVSDSSLVYAKNLSLIIRDLIVGEALGSVTVAVFQDWDSLETGFISEHASGSRIFELAGRLMAAQARVASTADDIEDSELPAGDHTGHGCANDPELKLKSRTPSPQDN